MTTDEVELQFIRCPGCRSLVPAVAQRCRMCGQLLSKDGQQDKADTPGEHLSRKPRVRQKTISVTGDDLENLKRGLSEDDSTVCQEAGEESSEPEAEAPAREVYSGRAAFRAGGLGRDLPVNDAEHPTEDTADRPSPAARGTDSNFWRAEHESPAEHKPAKSIFLEEAAKGSTDQFELEVAEPDDDDDEGDEDDADGSEQVPGLSIAVSGESTKKRKRRRKKKKHPVLDSDALPAGTRSVELSKPLSAPNPPPVSRQKFESAQRLQEPRSAELRDTDESSTQPRNRVRDIEKREPGFRLSVRNFETSPAQREPAVFERAEPADSITAEALSNVGSSAAVDSAVTLDKPAEPVMENREIDARSTRSPTALRFAQRELVRERAEVNAPIESVTGSESKEQVMVYAETTTNAGVTSSRAKHEARAEPIWQSEASAPLTGWFVHFSANPHGVSQEIRSGRYFISGQRLKETDLVVDHASVSTPHCVVQTSPDTGLKVQDLLSENGTFVRRVGETDYVQYSDAVEINHGDWLRIGSYEIMVCLVPKGDR